MAGLESFSRLAAGPWRLCRLQPEPLAHALSLAADHWTLAAMAAVFAKRAISHHRHHTSQTEPRSAALVRLDHAGRFRLDGIISGPGFAFSDADAGAQDSRK